MSVLLILIEVLGLLLSLDEMVVVVVIEISSIEDVMRN